MFVESHSTTLPTAPVVAWLISSSGTKVPGVGEEAILTAFVNLAVLAVTAEAAILIGLELIQTVTLKIMD